ncbi:MAG: glycosyltransferase [Chitinophagaceae bacterium]|nr:MAG: glycosyltransferase [Chitinophagaceae bacterium]
MRPPRPRGGTPVLGLVGYLDSNLDYGLLEGLLQEFIIHFIGPVSPANRERLGRFPHARFLGVKTGEALYEALQEVDVCIAPYDERVINKGATPNKLWLYLAMGKPAVVTNIPNIRSWKFEPGTVYKCANEEFIDACHRAYHEDNALLAGKRVALSQSNSWEERVRTIKQLYFGQPA